MAGKLPERRDVVAAILADRPADLLVVTGLGSPTYDVAASGDTDLNFYLWGAMGLAVPVGLGLALAKPDRRVLVVTGDGEMLMGLGSLASVGAKRPTNLGVLVLDNEAYGETGGQASHTGQGTDLCAVALGCGFAEARMAGAGDDPAPMRELLIGRPGPVLGVVKVARTEVARVLPPLDGVVLRSRFREALGGPG